jgi:hypothetical protein
VAEAAAGVKDFGLKLLTLLGSKERLGSFVEATCLIY